MAQTDFFLSHDWGKDEVGRGNHERVMQVNDHLKSLGLKTWFDQDKMSGDIVKQMAEGIEKTKVVLVFITKRYADKVNGNNEMDNCRLEFDHAVRRVQTSNMLAVIMDASMRRTADWKGKIGIQLGNKLFVDMSGNVYDPSYLEAQVKQLLDIVKTFPAMKGKNLQGSSTQEATALTQDEKANEVKATRAKSSRGQIKYTAVFTNRHNEEIDLIWKNYKGEEVIVRQGIAPGARHAENSYFTHPFIARDVVTEKVVIFSAGSKRGAVFEGMNFGAPHEGRIEVNIGR